MTFNVEKVQRKEGYRYRIVKNMVVNGVRKRTYKVLPKGTKKSVAEKRQSWSFCRIYC